MNVALQLKVEWWLQVTVASYVGAIGAFCALMAWFVWLKAVNNPITTCFEGHVKL